MAIEPVRSSTEEKPTREQLTVDPVAAAVTSRPANGAIDSSQQSEPELGEPQSTSQALSHAEKLLGLAAKLCGVRRRSRSLPAQLDFFVDIWSLQVLQKKVSFQRCREGGTMLRPCQLVSLLGTVFLLLGEVGDDDDDDKHDDDNDLWGQLPIVCV